MVVEIWTWRIVDSVCVTIDGQAMMGKKETEFKLQSISTSTEVRDAVEVVSSSSWKETDEV